MPTESQSTSPPKTFWWRLRSGIAVLFVFFVIGLLALLVWYRMNSLAAVGEPFDVRSFVSVSVPDDQNAFTYYRQAASLFIAEPVTVDRRSPLAASSRDNADEAILVGWNLSNKENRNWLRANRPVLDVWVRGTKCSNALEIPPAQLGLLNLPDCGFPRQFARLSLLEAARVSSEQPPADAWSWYRAALRFTRHTGMHAATLGRMVGTATHATCIEPILHWSSRKELAATDLRLALADVLSVDELTPLPSDNLKAEYLFCRASIEENSAGWSGLPLKLAGYGKRMEEALNMVFGNWLTQVDRPRFLRRPARGRQWLLFDPDPAAKPNSKDLSPAEIEDRCGLAEHTTAASIVSLLMPSVVSFIDAVDRERTRHAALVLGLALELYHREHGQFPAALDALVKEGYLKSIPADPFGKGEPFRYRREGDARQGAILWSVWTDGIDQSGKIDADRELEAASGDKIFRIVSPR